MADDALRVTCPACGSTDLWEEQELQSTQAVSEWQLVDGTLIPSDYGDYRDFSETVEPTGTYRCDACEWEGPVEELVINEFEATVHQLIQQDAKERQHDVG